MSYQPTITFDDPTGGTSRARIALIGPPGSGKTYTGLTLASALGERVAVLDTEHGSAAKYRHAFRFKHSVLTDFDPRYFIAGVKAAERAGFDVLLIDSMSHAWAGKGGALELVDKAARRSKSQNSYIAWGEVTPLYNEMIETIVGADLHIVVTMRSKTEYLIEQGNNGKSSVTKVGTAPVMRDGSEYEFDVVGELTTKLDMVVTKTRCSELHGAVINRPTGQVAETLLAWLNDVAPEPPARAAEESAAEAVEPAAVEEPAAEGPVAEPVEEPADVPVAGDPDVIGWPGFQARCRAVGITEAEARAILADTDAYRADMQGNRWRTRVNAWDAGQLTTAFEAIASRRGEAA